ncbi:MAG: cytochrome-c peroxidase, partial [Chitinophagaceae bacterium]|nr:cytochrome-c peroxidase [Chitinophagaceae bacterium]
MNIKYRIIIAGTLAALALNIQSCHKEPSTPTQPGDNNNVDSVDTVVMTPYDLVPPTYYPPAEIPENNKMYEERIDLGKRLFFDSRLSNDGSTCESCHQQKFGFSNDQVSQPDKGLTALPLINLAWYKNFMWNSRIIGTLEDVMYAEVTVRFKTDMAKINDISEYRIMFKKFYNIDEIKAEDLAKALAQYMRVLVSRDTKYDLYFKGQAQLTAAEERGRKIFFSEAKTDPNDKVNGGGDCFHCHVAVIAT